MNWKRVNWNRVLIEAVITAGAAAAPFALSDAVPRVKQTWAVVLTALASLILGLVNSQRRS